MSSSSPAIIFKSLQKIHQLILIITTIIIGSAYTYLNLNPSSKTSEYLILELIVPAYAIGSYIMTRYISKNRFRLDHSATINFKLKNYKQAKILEWTNIQSSALLASISYLITGQQNLILYAMMIGVMLLYFRPLKSKIAEELNLSPKELNSIS